jgi:hypothetical protein
LIVQEETKEEKKNAMAAVPTVVGNEIINWKRTTTAR